MKSRLKYRVYTTYANFTTTDPTTAVLGLCTHKWGIFALVGDPLQFHKREFHGTQFFSSPKIRVRRGPSVNKSRLNNENNVIYCNVMFTDIKLQPYGVRIDILWVLWDELRNWDDINWAGNWVRYDMKFILDKCCKKVAFCYNQTQICRYVVLWLRIKRHFPSKHEVLFF